MNQPPPAITPIGYPVSAVLLLATVVLLCWCAGRLLQVYRPRPSLVGRITEAKFAALLCQEGRPLMIDRKTASTVYRYLREIQGVAVAPLPEDDLVWDLGLTETQVEETVADLARRLHRSAEAEPFKRLPRTVRDLANSLQEMPKTVLPTIRRAA